MPEKKIRSLSLIRNLNWILKQTQIAFIEVKLMFSVTLVVLPIDIAIIKHHLRKERKAHLL